MFTLVSVLENDWLEVKAQWLLVLIPIPYKENLEAIKAKV